MKLLELKSPLADKLDRINNDANPTKVAENVKAEPAISLTNHDELVPVSASITVPSRNETTRATATVANSSSTSSHKAKPSGPSPNERPSAALRESNNTISTDPATAPITRTASLDLAADDSTLTDVYKVGVGDVLDIRHGLVELSREGSDLRLVTTKFNLKEIKSGKIQDPKLQPGDRIEYFH